LIKKLINYIVYIFNIIEENCSTKMYLSQRKLKKIFPFQKNANKRKATHTIENDERTANTSKNPNGNSGLKTERKENTRNDDKENQCPGN